MTSAAALLVAGLVAGSAGGAEGGVVEVDAFGKVFRAPPAAGKLADEDRTAAGDLYVEPSTLHCLGFEWEIRGDANRSGRCAVRYRKAGAAKWKAGHDLLRIRGEHVSFKNPDLAHVCGNLYAGSVLFLEPGTRYEVELTLSDGDNGPQPVAVRRLVAPTKAEPRKFDGGRALHVYPPGFDGTKSQPSFADLAAACARADAGDRILLHAGTYGGTYTLSKRAARDRPIVVCAAGDGAVAFRGEAKGKITRKPIAGTGEFHWHENAHCLDVDRAANLWIEGIAFRNYDSAIHCAERGATRGLTVRYCTFEDCGWSAILIRSTACRDLYIADNVFRGTQGTWRRKEAKPFPYKGVWIAGQGVDVCYNRVQNHKDGISVFQPGSKPAGGFEERMSALDFYHNDVGQSWDDNEADGGQHNIRFFCNRLVDQHVGLSAQPVYGGPCYFVRNVLYNVTRGVPFKLNCEPAGVLIYNNTVFGHATVGGRAWNVRIHNNVFVQPGGTNIRGGPFDPRISRIDYNGYTPGGKVSWLEHDGRRVIKHHTRLTPADLAERFGVDRHRAAVRLADFFRVPPPPGEAKTHRDLCFGDPRPREGSAVVDAGMVIDNITDGFAGKAPDLGAYELGEPLRHYGPRPRGRQRRTRR